MCVTSISLKASIETWIFTFLFIETGRYSFFYLLLLCNSLFCLVFFHHDTVFWYLFSFIVTKEYNVSKSAKVQVVCLTVDRVLKNLMLHCQHWQELQLLLTSNTIRTLFFFLFRMRFETTELTLLSKDFCKGISLSNRKQARPTVPEVIIAIIKNY